MQLAERATFIITELHYEPEKVSKSCGAVDRPYTCPLTYECSKEAARGSNIKSFSPFTARVWFIEIFFNANHMPGSIDGY